MSCLSWVSSRQAALMVQLCVRHLPDILCCGPAVADMLDYGRHFCCIGIPPACPGHAAADCLCFGLLCSTPAF